MRWFAPIAGAVAFGCSGAPDERAGDLDQATDQVVYGAPTRVRVEDLSAPLREVVEQRTLALVPAQAVHQSGSTVWIVEGAPSVGAMFGLCSEHPLAEDPAVARCTGFAITDRLVATAAHCIERESACDGLRLVKGFFSGGSGTLPSGSLFSCRVRTVEQRDRSATPGCAVEDIAILELDRPIEPFVASGPATVRNGDHVVACGHSFGAPLRCDVGAVVSEAVPGDLRVAADVAIGASGGPVLDHEGKLAGLITAGAPDLVAGEGCAAEVQRNGPGMERLQPAAAIEKFALSQRVDCASRAGDNGAACAVRASVGLPSPARKDALVAMFSVLALPILNATSRLGQQTERSKRRPT